MIIRQLMTRANMNCFRTTAIPYTRNAQQLMHRGIPTGLKRKYFSGSAVIESPSQVKRISRCNRLVQSIENDMLALQHIHTLLTSESMVHTRFHQLVERLVDCHFDDRCIFVTGIGKSGIVARRLASSLSSISVRSQWIQGSEWIHGELGNLKPGDVVVIISHSGETAELVQLPTYFRRADCEVLAIVGHESTTLGQCSDITLPVPAIDTPACPLPSRSIIVQEAVSNAIVEYMIEVIDDRLSEFRDNHPGGAIGTQLHQIDS